MKTYLSYAGFFALANALLNLALYFLGYQTTNLQTGQYFGWLAMLIQPTILFFGLREARDNKPAGEAFTWANGLVAALAISAFAGVFNALYTFIHFSFVNPDFSRYMIEFMRTQMEAAGKMSSTQIDQVLGFQAMFFKAPVQAGMTLIFTPVMGLLWALIIAIFTRRKLPEAIPQA